jgi:hypothetical protein
VIQPKAAAAHHAALMEYYQGEVLGEAMFDSMLAGLSDEIERYKMGLLLQLETETKARLRPVLAAQGLPVQEDPSMRPQGERFARELQSASWAEKMSALHKAVAETYLPRYRELASQLPAVLRDVGEIMVEHESALVEMTRREIDGQAERSDQPLLKLLQFPLSRPRSRRTRR